jgi:fumarylpyruvate hydrolase
MSEVGHPQSGRIWLKVNDEIRQDVDLKQLLWSVPEQIAHLALYLAAWRSDVHRTPEGVGSVNPGDRITGGVDGVDEIEIRIAS